MFASRVSWFSFTGCTELCYMLCDSHERTARIPEFMGPSSRMNLAVQAVFSIMKTCVQASDAPGTASLVWYVNHFKVLYSK
jgi:hypothetical protein